MDAAIRAPSVLNTQPWRFVFSDDRLEVWEDPDRLLPDTDPDGRFMAVSCGAAAYNACLAIRSLGHEAWIQVQPRPQSEHLAAAVHIGVRRPVASEDFAKFDMIPARHTARGPYREWRLPFSLITRLEEAAEAEGAYFRVLTTHETERVRHIIQAAEQVEEGERDLDQEMASWIGERRVEDGIPAAALGPRPVDRRTPVRDLDPHGHTGPRDLATFERRPTLAVLATPGDSHKDWVRAGMALECVLLTAALHGVAASFLNAPVERGDRAQLRSTALGLEYPQMVLRLGYPQGGSVPTPRRPAEQVTSTGRSRQ